MKDFLDYLVKSIVDKPEAVNVTEANDGQGFVTLNLTVDQTDMGKIIGLLRPFGTWFTFWQ